MVEFRTGVAHSLRKALFIRGLRQGFLAVDEVDEALSPGLMSAAERWLFFFSLHASGVQLRDAAGRPLSPDEAAPGGRVGWGGAGLTADQPAE